VIFGDVLPSHILLVNSAISMGAGALGVGVAWGVLKEWRAKIDKRLDTAEENWLAFNGKNQPFGEPLWMRRTDCNYFMSQAKDAGQEKFASAIKEIEALKECAREQLAAQKALQNFALWMLTKQEGMALDKAQEILDGRGW